MSWQNRFPPWVNGPWLYEEYYPWQTDSLPWLIENDEAADWTARTPIA